MSEEQVRHIGQEKGALPTRQRVGARPFPPKEELSVHVGDEQHPYWFTSWGKYHRAECPFIRSGYAISEADLAEAMTRTYAKACGHCEPNVRPAGLTPGERQEVERLTSPQGECRTKFGFAPTRSEAQLALLQLHQEAPDLVRTILDAVISVKRPGTPEATQALQRLHGGRPDLRLVDDQG